MYAIYIYIASARAMAIAVGITSLLYGCRVLGFQIRSYGATGIHNEDGLEASP